MKKIKTSNKLSFFTIEAFALIFCCASYALPVHAQNQIDTSYCEVFSGANRDNLNSCNRRFYACIGDRTRTDELMKACGKEAVDGVQGVIDSASRYVAPTTPSAQCATNDPKCTITYVPLEPLPALGGATGDVSTGGLAALVNYLFPIIITLAAMISVLMFTFWGVEYMITASMGKKSQAKDHLLGVLYGVILLVSSVLILLTINPTLVEFNLDKLLEVAGMTNRGSSGGAISSSGGATPSATPSAPPATAVPSAGDSGPDIIF